MPHTGAHLLYVDDDAVLVRLVERSLGRRGFVVEHAASAEEALARIRAGGIEVVALDHHLGNGTGLDVLAALATVEGAPAVVYVTGSADMHVAVAALKAGATDFVFKTVGEDFFELLFSALGKAVEKTRLRSQKEAAEREVRIAKERAEVLLREVNHRVANSLSLVASLVNLQTGATRDEQARAALAETQARIFAISLVHRSLYSAGDVRVVELSEYLTSLLDHLRSSMTSQGSGASLVLDIEQAKVATDIAINLGVVVTELVTNALKYAYPEGGAGEIRVALARRDEGALELTVVDQGVGWTGEGAIKGTGLGSRIIRAMADGLHGEFSYPQRVGGTTARLVFTPAAAA